MGWILLAWSAAACFPTGTARAVAVTDYITVQPIDVCPRGAGTTVGCAPINDLTDGGNNYKTAAVGDVGSIDVTDGGGHINVTRAIWSQIGIDVTFLPAVQYPSAGGFLTLAIDSCAQDGSNCMSQQFKTLSQQPGISGNPPPPISPNPNPPNAPVSPNPTTINGFFVNGLSPPAGTGTLFGLAWVNNNGIANAMNSLVGGAARPDTLAHEIGHDLDLDHTTFGNLVPGSTPRVGFANNLMTAGDPRSIPTSPADAIGSIGAGMGSGTKDQLLPTQKTQVLRSGLMNPIPLVNTPATGTDFTVSFQSGGRMGEKMDSLTLTAPTPLFSLGTKVEFNNPVGIPIPPPPTPSDCSASGCTSLIFDFTHGASFVAGDGIHYSICGPAESCNPISVDTLAGGTYTYTFETDQVVDDKSVPIELFQTTSQLLNQPGDLFSDSQHPDLMIPSEILNPDTFVGFSAEPCTIIAASTTCPPLVLADAFPPEEDKPVPEPPSILILLSSLAVLGLGYRCSSRARRSFETGLA
jgi:hypothetical protein